jgi:hypothetical protein
VAPAEARTGDAVTVTAVVTPARAGTPVHLLVGDEVVDSAVQDDGGYAVLAFDAPSPGATTLRGRVPVPGSGAEVTSPPVVLRVLPPLSQVPRVDIVTDDGQPITSKEVYTRATLGIDPQDSGLPAYLESARLRVRGNFTATGCCSPTSTTGRCSAPRSAWRRRDAWACPGRHGSSTSRSTSTAS